MKTTEVFALDAWIADHKSWIMQSNPTIKDIRARAEAELQFKCASGPIRDCMNRNEIPIRRSKAEAEKQMMIEQIDELTELVLDLVAHGNLPQDLLMKFRTRSRNLNKRVMTALQRQADQQTA